MNKNVIKAMKLLQYFLCLLIISISFQSLCAQGSGSLDPEYIEDDGGDLWDKRIFEDASGMQQDFDSGGGEYIGEEEAVEAIEEAVKSQTRSKRINFEEVLVSEKELKYDNIKYGALTGVMIGGWLAMVSNLSDSGSTSRDNARYIGVGAVLGVLMGTAIGTKSLYQENLRSENGIGPENFQITSKKLPWEEKFSMGASSSGIAQLNFNHRF